MNKLPSIQPYKGTRDFFPEEMRSRKWMFEVLEKAVEKFGYEKYDAPIIEPLEIYQLKTSEEIVSQQIYSFIDRGKRQVAIRPEMTPTVARMIAAKNRELPKPIRWYSLPNLWRYERPGKGRLREHWQLNCDLFAAQDELAADLEILTLAVEILQAFGATEKHFTVQINDRRILNFLFSHILELPEKQWNSVARTIDKKEKITNEEYFQSLAQAGLTTKQLEKLDQYLSNGTNFLKNYENTESLSSLTALLRILEESQYASFIRYDPSIVRGFDYYTGMVFEIFDTHPENRRSLFGGGRYNNLIKNYAKVEINAVGFGLGDVTLEDFLRTHGLHKTFSSSSQVFLVSLDDKNGLIKSLSLAHLLRKEGFQTETSLSSTKLGKQIQMASAKNIPFVLILGKEEIENNSVSVKNIETGIQETVAESQLIDFLHKNLSTNRSG